MHHLDRANYFSLNTHQSHILLSKFIKPKPSPDLVVRPGLFDYLSKGARKPLILVSAPAGFGKSTLISSWLDHQSLRFGWISMSEYDSDCLSFLRYLVTCLNNSTAGLFEDILSFLNAPELPDNDVVAQSVVNKLLELNEDFYLILDDYHYLHEPEIHRFINTLLQFPVDNFHLIVISRIDPPFRIQQLRAKNLITELRSRNLVFRDYETTAFLRNTIDPSVSSEVCQFASKITDGWITGLRLFSLIFRNRNKQIDEFLEVSEGKLFEELVDEIFMEFAPEVQQFVLRSSVLHQFNVSICDKICDFEPHYSATDILNVLKVSNLFIIPVYEERGWYRFHHLFQDYLRRKFEETYSDEEQKAVHRAAGVWLRDHEILKGAIIHFIKSADIDEAVSIFEIYRHQIMNEAKWPEFSQVLGLFDKDTVKTYAELMLAQAWFNIYVGKPFEMFVLLDPIQALIHSSSSSTEKHNRYLAEFNCLLPYKTYNVDRNFHEAIVQCDFALDHLHADQRYVKGFAWIFKLGSLQAIGKYVDAKKLFAKNLEERAASTIDSHLYLVMNFLQWMEADFPALFETSALLIKSSIEGSKNLEAFANGNHFFGIGKYMINELESANIHLRKSNDNRHYTVGIINIMNSIALVMLYLALNKIHKADRIIREIKSEVKNKRSYLFNTMLDAVHAEIYLSKNDVDKAMHHLKEIEHIPLSPFSNFYAPQFTLVKVLIYKKDPSSLSKAKRLLKEYLGFTKETHNKLFEMKFLGLLALIYLCQNEISQAFSILQEILFSAKTHKPIRVLLDCGPMMKELLIQYKKSVISNSYVHELIQAFPSGANEIVLTSREMEILPLLYFSNKEIATNLYITEKTVKNHISSIFKKLNTKNRREAIQKAKELNLIKSKLTPA